MIFLNFKKLKLFFFLYIFSTDKAVLKMKIMVGGVNNMKNADYNFFYSMHGV
jgi:hypothetical protein